MKEFHYSMCEEHQNQQPIIQLSLDGVQESKSSTASLDTYSIQFEGCRNIYPIRLIRPCDKFKYDEQDQLKEVLEDINENNFVIDCAIFDNLKRSTARCSKNHAARHPCEYCFNGAVSHAVTNKKIVSMIEKNYTRQESQVSQELEELINSQDPEEDKITRLRQQLITLANDKEAKLKKIARKQLTWPASTMKGNLRTLEKIEEIVNEIETNPNVLKNDPDFCKGIKGRSLFLDQPLFHMVNDMPCEYLHGLCIGVVKRLVILCFKVGENRERITTRKLSNPDLYNEKMESIQVARECSRRCRNLDVGVMKASEYRNILIFFFPIVLNCIEETAEEEREMWLHLVFMIRSCVIPNNEFVNINPKLIETACEKFYTLFEKLYGPTNCSYSVHMVPSHLLQIRGNMPLPYRSAFKFESFYGEMRNMFKPGTVSPLKQILKNCYVKRKLEHHQCQKPLFLAPIKKPKEGVKFNPGKENNHLVYVYDEKKYEMYSIDKQIDSNTFECNIQGKFTAKFPSSPEYKWSDVGCFKVGPLSEETVIIKRSQICGKVMIVDGYLITCPTNVLHEQ